VRFWLFYAKRLRGATSAKKASAAADPQAPQETGLPYRDGQDIVFDEETSTDEMRERPEALLSRLITRISTAFGLWGDRRR